MVAAHSSSCCVCLVMTAVFNELVWDDIPLVAGGFCFWVYLHFFNSLCAIFNLLFGVYQEWVLRWFQNLTLVFGIILRRQRGTPKIIVGILGFCLQICNEYLIEVPFLFSLYCFRYLKCSFTWVEFRNKCFLLCESSFACVLECRA